jgi:hypothetical protein
MRRMVAERGRLTVALEQLYEGFRAIDRQQDALEDRVERLADEMGEAAEGMREVGTGVNEFGMVMREMAMHMGRFVGSWEVEMQVMEARQMMVFGMVSWLEPVAVWFRFWEGVLGFFVFWRRGRAGEGIRPSHEMALGGPQGRPPPPPPPAGGSQAGGGAPPPGGLGNGNTRGEGNSGGDVRGGGGEGGGGGGGDDPGDSEAGDGGDDDSSDCSGNGGDESRDGANGGNRDGDGNNNGGNEGGDGDDGDARSRQGDQGVGGQYESQQATGPPSQSPAQAAGQAAAEQAATQQAADQAANDQAEAGSANPPQPPVQPLPGQIGSPFRPDGLPWQPYRRPSHPEHEPLTPLFATQTRQHSPTGVEVVHPAQQATKSARIRGGKAKGTLISFFTLLALSLSMYWFPYPDSWDYNWIHVRPRPATGYLDTSNGYAGPGVHASYTKAAHPIRGARLDEPVMRALFSAQKEARSLSALASQSAESALACARLVHDSVTTKAKEDWYGKVGHDGEGKCKRAVRLSADVAEEMVGLAGRLEWAFGERWWGTVRAEERRGGRTVLAEATGGESVVGEMTMTADVTRKTEAAGWQWPRRRVPAWM